MEGKIHKRPKDTHKHHDMNGPESRGYRNLFSKHFSDAYTTEQFEVLVEGGQLLNVVIHRITSATSFVFGDERDELGEHIDELEMAIAAYLAWMKRSVCKPVLGKRLDSAGSCTSQFDLTDADFVNLATHNLLHLPKRARWLWETHGLSVGMMTCQSNEAMNAKLKKGLKQCVSGRRTPLASTNVYHQLLCKLIDTQFIYYKPVLRERAVGMCTECFVRTTDGHKLKCTDMACGCKSTNLEMHSRRDSLFRCPHNPHSKAVYQSRHYTLDCDDMEEGEHALEPVTIANSQGEA